MISIKMLLFGFAAFASDNQITVCNVTQNDLLASVSISSVMSAGLTVNSKGQRYQCDLEIIGAEDQLTGHLPQLFYEFRRKECRPQLPQELEKQVLQNLNLEITQFEKAPPTGTFQWNKFSQPNDCRFVKFRLLENKLGIQKLTGSTR